MPIYVDMEQKKGAEWLRLIDATSATGLAERTLQRKVEKGEIQRQTKGYGQTFYLIPQSLMKARREEGEALQAIRAHADQQTETIEVATDALQRITVGLTKRLQEMESREDALRQDAAAKDKRANRFALAAALLLSASVGLSALLWNATGSLASERATSRQVADSLKKAGLDLTAQKAVSSTLEAKVAAQEKATRAAEEQRDNIATLLTGYQAQTAQDCQEAVDMPTVPH